MIQVVPLQIHKETSSEKEAYLQARGSKFERMLRAAAPDRDASQDERNKQAYLRHLRLLAESGIAGFSLVALEDSAALASAQSFKEKVDAIFPLIDGETLIEEQVGEAANRIYVKQVTNLSTICFTDPSLALAPEVAGAAEPPAPAAGAVADNAQEEAEALQKVSKTVVDIGKGLVKVVPAPYGTVLSGVFEGLSTYLSLTSTSQAEKDTEKTISRIGELVGKITWEANVKQTVKEQLGVIRAVVEGLNDHYGPLKKESKADDTRKELVDNYLTPWLLKLDVVIGTLADEDYDVASLPEYCLAAGAYFCILQELAVLDHDHQDDPFKSTRCTEIKDIKAPKFINHVNTTFDRIINKARESVSSTTEYKYKYGESMFRKIYLCPSHEKEYHPPEFFVDFDTIGGWYYDNGTFGSYPNGYQFCPSCGHSTWAYDECGKARNTWVSLKQAELVNQIEIEMGALKKLANVEWAKLKTHPLYGSDRMAG